MDEKSKYIDILVHLASAYGLYGTAGTSTMEIAKKLNVSQQTASRKLEEMRRKDLISKKVTINGTEIMLKKKSHELLKEHYDALKKIFRVKGEIEGKVFSGIDEGKYYISQYLGRIKTELNFDPYQGTLNIRVKPEEARRFLSSMNPITISGFSTKTRSFGGIRCYRVKVNGKADGAVIVPDRTKYSSDVFEVVSPVHLRTEFGLKDNSKVKLSSC